MTWSPLLDLRFYLVLGWLLLACSPWLSDLPAARAPGA